MTERLCETCAYYDCQGKGVGWCRRWPPTVIVDPGPYNPDFYDRWPQASPSDWCGEWTKK